MTQKVAMEKWKTFVSRLPKQSTIQPDHELLFYGALHTVASYCGLSSPLRTDKISWNHGIVEDDCVSHLRDIVNYGGPANFHLVARDSHLRILDEYGCKNAMAIGMPFLYTEPPSVDRLESSLLVMPAHSTNHSGAMRDEETYVEAVLPMMEKFDLAVFCIHGSCIERGLWSKTLDKMGIPWVVGAAIDDTNALVRLRLLFSMFECVTANCLVSGLAYASSSGCRISLHAPFFSPQESEWEKEPFYKQNPQLLASHVQRASEAATRLRLPWLFVPPEQSEVRPEWGNYLVGTAHKKSPTELRKILGWTPLGQAKLAIARLRKWIYKRR